ncbi:MAG: DUF4442 domain-containing protein [Lysobacteraceae bacterium]|nr:MAG: DUF4442 domain-containing protein [Xanthomonadaceae bacterium]
MKASLFRLVMNAYPPYLGTGVWVKRVSPDYRELDVELGLHWYNRNWVGTHFGGNLCAMADPFYMLMLIPILGRDYIVWDKASCIDFVRPGRGRVYAEFRVTDQMLDQIKAATAEGEKYEPKYPVNIHDGNGECIARVEKTMYIRRKRER